MSYIYKRLAVITGYAHYKLFQEDNNHHFKENSKLDFLCKEEEFK
jgi:hypothetical protein